MLGLNKHPGLPGSVVENLKPGEDKFRGAHSLIDWQPQLNYAVQMGLGSREYELITI